MKAIIVVRNKLLTVDSFSMSSSEAPSEARPIFCHEKYISEKVDYVNTFKIN